MVLRLDPAILSVWRSPDSLQFGIDPVLAVLDGVDERRERMIASLEVGTTASGLGVLFGAGEASRLVTELGGLLEERGDDAATPPLAAVPEVRIRSAALAGIRSQLALLLPTASPRAAVGVPALLVVDHVVAPAEHLRWLRADRAHLAIVFGERSALVGPVVRPGVTACLRCRDLHRCDEDAAWPAVATQLLGRPAAAATDARLVADALATGLAALAGGRGDGVETAVRIELDGARSSVPLVPHPECGCLGLVG